LPAVEVRHLPVHDDEIGARDARAFDRLAAVGDLDDRIAFAAEHGAEQLTDRRIVVGDENRSGGVALRRLDRRCSRHRFGCALDQRGDARALPFAVVCPSRNLDEPEDRLQAVPETERAARLQFAEGRARVVARVRAAADRYVVITTVVEPHARSRCAFCVQLVDETSCEFVTGKFVHVVPPPRTFFTRVIPCCVFSQ
jgi:hypothetical protein